MGTIYLNYKLCYCNLFTNEIDHEIYCLMRGLTHIYVCANNRNRTNCGSWYNENNLGCFAMWSFFDIENLNSKFELQNLSCSGFCFYYFGEILNQRWDVTWYLPLPLPLFFVALPLYHYLLILCDLPLPFIFRMGAVLVIGVATVTLTLTFALEILSCQVNINSKLYTKLYFDPLRSCALTMESQSSAR